MKKYIKSKFKKIKAHLKHVFGYTIDKLVKKYVNKTIIVSGFWRSGTTFLQTKICASIRGKSIFEPFGPDVSNNPIYINSGLDKSNLSRKFQNCFMPYGEYDKTKLEFLKFLHDCFIADIKSRVVRRLRKSIFTSFTRTVVCKFVRGHLLIPFLLEQNPYMPIIHISRNPKAVIASIVRSGWGNWFNEFYLSDHLLKIEDGRINYFSKFSDLIDKYDKMDVESRICAYWCLMEKYIHDTCSDKKNFLLVQYEDLISNGFDVVKNFLTNLNHKWHENNIENFSSATTNLNRILLTSEEKRDSWSIELDSQTQKKIDNILLDFNII